MVQRELRNIYLHGFLVTLTKAKVKSARKDDVFTREIQAGFEAYPPTVIAFREGLRCICFHYDLFSEKTSVKIIDHGTSPKDSHINIFK